MKNLSGAIEQTKAELLRAKPRSRRHTQLEIRLRDLMVQQMKREIRGWKAA